MRYIFLFCLVLFVSCRSANTPCGPGDPACNPFIGWLLYSGFPDGDAGLNVSEATPGSTVTLRASKGAAPYSYSILVGRGSVTSSGIFHAPNTLGVTTILVQDAGGGQFIDTVRVVGSQGNGSFQTGVDTNTCTTIGTISAADFNADGNLDVVAICSTAIRMHFGDGDGTFTTGADFALGSAGIALGIGDFNRDGVLDLAYHTNNNHGIAVGNGDGTFTGSWASGFAVAPQGLTVADFNQDGIDDIVFAENTKGEIYLGQGDGTAVHSGTTIFNGGGNPQDVTHADLNGDYIQDLAFTDRSSGGSPLAFLGNGDGTFSLASSQPEVGAAQELSACDLNADGKMDLVVGDIGAGNVTSYTGDGAGGFSLVASVIPAGSGLEIFCGEFNNDGHMDVASFNTGNPYILLGNGDGTLQSPVMYSATSPGDSGLAADFNNDGIFDLATPNSAGSNFGIMLGN